MGSGIPVARHPHKLAGVGRDRFGIGLEITAHPCGGEPYGKGANVYGYTGIVNVSRDGRRVSVFLTNRGVTPGNLKAFMAASDDLACARR